MKMDGSGFEEKSPFKILGLTFSSKLDWGSHIVSIAKTVPKKIGVLIRSMKFLSPEVALYLYKSTIGSCMKYCCHGWSIGPSLAASIEPLANYQNAASLNLFYRYYYGRCSSELAELVPLPYSRGKSTRYFF